MDRRQYLGLTGAGITALLGGCSSSEGGGSGSDEGSTPTYTDTPFRNETGTPTPVGTPTPKITDTPTTTPTATATPTSTPEPGKELQQKAADLGLSIRAVRWLDQEQTPDEEYGLNDSQIDRILNAEPGMQLERAVEILEPEDYSGGVGGTFNTPSKTLTDQVAGDLRAIFQNDLGRYNTVYPQSRVFGHRNTISHGIFAGNEGNLSASHPKDKILDEDHSANAKEISDYLNENNKEISGFSTTEDYLCGAFKPMFRPGGKLLPQYVLEDSESVLAAYQGADAGAFRGIHELYGRNIPVINQGQRDNMAVQMSEAGLKVLDDKFMPSTGNGTAQVSDSLPYIAIADAVYNQENLDLYEDQLPSDQAIRVGSKGPEGQNEEFQVQVENVNDVDFGKMPTTI